MYVNSTMPVMKLVRPLFQNLSLSNFFRSTAVRNLTYVEKCRYIQKLKEDDIEVKHCLAEGKYLVFNGSKPLVKSSQTSQAFEINWVSVKDLLSDHKSAIMQTSVLIDVDDNKKPRFAIQLRNFEKDIVEAFESNTNGCFKDLRTAVFMVGWNEGHILSRGNSLLRFHAENIFCSRCARKMIRNGAGNTRRCTECKITIYPYANPVGIVLVTDPTREHALLVRQHRLPPNIFTCIAGFGDAGETLESTVKREVAEEVGIEVHSVEYVMSQHWPFPSSLMAGCYAVAEKSQIKIDESELEDGRWFTKQEISEAVARIEAHPFGFLRDPSEGISIPPPGAIASQLICHWIKNTPVKEIFPSVQ